MVAARRTHLALPRGSLYVSYARGFRFPNLDESFGSFGFAPELEPERAHGVEVGGAWRSERAELRAALYAMVDPVLVDMVRQAMGAGYLVWDRAGSIEILAPAHGRVWARAELLDEQLRHMRAMTDSGDKHLHLFAVDIRDEEGMTVSRVKKLIYVRRRGQPA